MKSLRNALLALVLVVGLTGCFDVQKTVKVQADGSGTVEETVVISKAAFASMQQMAAGFGGDKGKATDAKGSDMFDEAKLKAAAAQMGEGVTFVSAQKIDNEHGEGFAATYAFADINKLIVDQNPGEAVPGGQNIKVNGRKKEPIVFHFTKGSPAELRITMPAPEFKARKEQPPGMEDMVTQAMKQMFKDMRMSLNIEVQGTIKETNAEYHDGSRVTLMDMDFNKLIADPEKFKAFAHANPQSLQEAKALIKGLDGVKIETAPEVKIHFQQ